MKVHEIQEAFGLDHLVLADRPDPTPGPGQVVVRVAAASLNFRDLMTVRGHYNPRQPLPLVPCSDGVGEVRAVGDGVTRVAVGDRVCGIFNQAWLAGRFDETVGIGTLGGPLDGMLAEQVVLDAEGVVKVPEHLSDDEAATLPCAAVTAWSALVEEGGLKAGDSVLVQGTGGVSLFALQFAKLFGAQAIVTSSSDAKLERARELGADVCINYAEDPKWHKAVRAATDGRGVDHVVEVGGAGTLASSMGAVRPGGHIAVIGVLSGFAKELDILPVLMRRIRLQGIFVGSRATFEDMNRAIAASGLRPVVDRTFAFDEARAAFDTMASATHFGKLVVRCR